MVVVVVAAVAVAVAVDAAVAVTRDCEHTKKMRPPARSTGHRGNATRASLRPFVVVVVVDAAAATATHHQNDAYQR